MINQVQKQFLFKYTVDIMVAFCYFLLMIRYFQFSKYLS